MLGIKECYFTISAKQDLYNKIDDLYYIMARSNTLSHSCLMSNIRQYNDEGNKYDFCIHYIGEYGRFPDSDIEEICRDIARYIFDNNTLSDIDIKFHVDENYMSRCFITKLVN